jgi:hypothetical protein
MKKQVRTSSSRIVSLTRFCTMCCVALAPTRPPRPGPLTGKSGRIDFFGSILSFSRFRFEEGMNALISSSRNPSPGVRMGAVSRAADASSMVMARLSRCRLSNFTPFMDVWGE